jgi:DNA (cytosine-5)-methyltransferase 1
MKGIKLLYIDLFCGAGGTSTGIASALYNGEKCAKVIASVNHDANAIASHAANHPDVLHFTEDIRTLDLQPLVEHLKKMRIAYPEALVVVHASLECTNFSNAKGGKPRDADSRTLAEHLYRYVEALDPDYLQIENVKEFMSWGDLDENGKPISWLAGKSYTEWVENIKKYGYHYEWRILNSADYGAYTSRKRFFGQFAKPQLPIQWPEPTHDRKPTKSLFGGSLKKWKPVKDVLDFSDEGESIFTRKKPLSDKTLERIYAGLIKFVAGGKDKWMLKYNSVNGTTGRHVPPSLDDPCPVVSTQERLGVVQVKFLSKHYSGHPDSKNKSINEPADTITAIDHHSLVSARFLGMYCNARGKQEGNVISLENPSPTVTVFDRISLVSAKFLDMQYGKGTPSSVNTPAPTLTTNPKHHVVACYLMNPQYFSAGGSIDDPCFTLIARMDKMPPYLIQAETGELAIVSENTDTPAMQKVKEFMALYGIIDIKMRMLRIPELKRIMGFSDSYTLIGTQAEQKKFIGNAVEVTMAKALCESTCKAAECHYEMKTEA